MFYLVILWLQWNTSVIVSYFSLILLCASKLLLITVWYLPASWCQPPELYTLVAKECTSLVARSPQQRHVLHAKNIWYRNWNRWATELLEKRHNSSVWPLHFPSILFLLLNKYQKQAFHLKAYDWFYESLAKSFWTCDDYCCLII